MIRSRLVRTTVGSFRAEQGSGVMVGLYVTQTKAGRSEFEACLGHLVSKKTGSYPRVNNPPGGGTLFCVLVVIRMDSGPA